MKVVILAGGFGTRISEESHLKPKPMIEIGEKPILWHIMKMYSAYGFNEFVICCGYKQHVIKEWFADYYLHNSNITFDFTQENKMIVHNNVLEPWKVTLVDTGLNTMTGGRIKRVKEYLDGDTFMLTYGDGVADVNIRELLEYHRSMVKWRRLQQHSREDDLVSWIFRMMERSRILKRRKKKTEAGSMPDLWCWSRPLLI